MIPSRLLTLKQLERYSPCGSGLHTFKEACREDTLSPRNALLIQDDPAWVWRFARHFHRRHLWWVADRLMPDTEYHMFADVVANSRWKKLEQKWERELYLPGGDRLRGCMSVIPLAVFAHLYVNGARKK